MTNGTHGVRCEVSGGVATVQLDRPDKLNALTLATLRELAATAHRLRRDRTLRAVLVTGSGRSFCAGLDFAAVNAAGSRAVGLAFVPRPWRGTNVFQEACWAWRRIPVPVIAVVRGHCFGGGLQIALGADLRFTTPDAQWSVMEGRWGLVPDMSGVRSLAQQIGPDLAKRLTMTGEIISGEEAARIGLATAATDEPDVAAAEFIDAVLERSPDAVAATKRLFESRWVASPRRTFARERREQALLLGAPNTARIRRAAARNVTPDFRARLLP